MEEGFVFNFGFLPLTLTLVFLEANVNKVMVSLILGSLQEGSNAQEAESQIQPSSPSVY